MLHQGAVDEDITPTGTTQENQVNGILKEGD
jgi:hypothetical protein